LYLEGPGVARGYLGRPELTAERFVELRGRRLYRTGDLARLLPDGNLVFLGRADAQLKVRGFRIEPGEIESVLATHEWVSEAAVVAMPEPGGDRRLVAYVVPREGRQLTSAALHGFLAARLPAYMVPGAFFLLPELPLTRHGKVDRADLARRDILVRHVSSSAYVAPRTPIEEMLAAIWAEVLGIERVGADDDFFQLSGHSLLATQVAYRVKVTFGVELPLARLFERATLSELAQEIEAATLTGSKRAALEAPITPVPRDRELLPSTFNQEWLWFLQGGPVGSVLNLPFAFELRWKVDVRTLQRSFDEVVRRHEALRTRFHKAGAEIFQIVDPPAPVPVPVLGLEALPAELQAGEVSRIAALHPAHEFDLVRGPLLLTHLLRRGESDHLLLLTFHHIIIDGWSVGLIQNELAALYEAFARGLPSPLLPPRLQLADFAVWQRRTVSAEAAAEEVEYWRRHLANRPPDLALPFDHPRPEEIGPEAVSDGDLLSAELSQQLLNLARATSCTLASVLLAALDVLLYRYTGEGDLLVMTAFSGRSRAELSPVVGILISMVIIRADLSDAPTFAELCVRVRDAMLAAYNHQDLPYPRLLAELFPGRRQVRTLLSRVMFNMISFPGAEVDGIELPVESVSNAKERAKYDLLITASEGQGRVDLAVTGSTDVFELASVRNIFADYVQLLAALAADQEIRIDQVLPTLHHRESRESRESREARESLESRKV
ncbi:MAG: condensation domain-containing protein, partial [Acidobacteriota bacterium]|nr:condensation domain-containing protein [Acidobacteriota bacterium]